MRGSLPPLSKLALSAAHQNPQPDYNHVFNKPSREKAVEMTDTVLTKTKILVVEDESIVALDIQQRLESMGYHVVGLVDTGERAVSAAEAHRPHLVLMDIKLKGKMDGIQAAQIIRAKLNLPIIFLTAFADQVTLQRARVTDSFGYILKPFEERELAIHIEMALYKHQMETRLRDSESRLRTLFASVRDGLLVIEAQGKILDANPAGCALFGYTREALVGLSLGELGLRDAWDALFASAGSPADGEAREYPMRHRSGAEVWVELTLAPIAEADPAQVVGVFRDITRRRQAAEALRESEERYSLAAQGVNDGLWDWQLRTGTVYFSPRWKSMLGFAEDEVGATSDDWLRLIHPDDIGQFRLDLSSHLSGLTGHFQNESRLHTKLAAYRWMLTRGVAVRDADGVAYRLAGSQSDITERKQAEAQLLHDAFHDALTGLPNRALFLDRLAQALERAQRHAPDSFAVLFLDLDRFKVINDSLGHLSGDQVLTELATRLHRLLRPADTLARLGGDEFVILLEDLLAPQDAEVVAKRIQEEMKAPFMLDGQPFFVSASVGIVIGAAGYERAEDILRDADTAMYRAKAEGKARYALFDPSLRERAVTRLELEGDLRLALNRHEFQVFYQPILSLETSQVSGFEALLRWFHPTRGPIAPADFIPVAEETGTILSIGRWVLREACCQLHRWQDRFPRRPPLTMSVNISGRQFTQPAFADHLQQTLQETGLNPQTLKLEITESLFLADSKIVVNALTRVRELGVQLLIDDFGTGFSSLGYVQHFPIQTIKIDRLFVQQMGAAGKQAEVAQTLVHLANELGLGTIAEGIETVEQLTQLRAMACEAGQGWLFSKAESPAELEAYLERTLGARPA
jgi:diguanylate cyclase (GGDEF)-like protein/PAS domain S-box-containing protein